MSNSLKAVLAFALLGLVVACARGEPAPAPTAAPGAAEPISTEPAPAQKL